MRTRPQAALPSHPNEKVRCISICTVAAPAIIRFELFQTVVRYKSSSTSNYFGPYAQGQMMSMCLPEQENRLCPRSALRMLLRPLPNRFTGFLGRLFLFCLSNELDELNVPPRNLNRKPREIKPAGKAGLEPPLSLNGASQETHQADGQESVKAIIAQWRRERPDLDFEPMSLFASLARGYLLMSAKIEHLVSQYGLTRGMFDVLATLRRAGEPYSLTPKQLSASLLLSGAGMTSRLDRLEALKFVARVPEPRDRRSLQIKMTKRGLDLVDRILPELLETQRGSFAFGVQNARDLIKLLAMMNEKLHPVEHSDHAT